MSKLSNRKSTGAKCVNSGKEKSAVLTRRRALKSPFAASQRQIRKRRKWRDSMHEFFKRKEKEWIRLIKNY